MKFTNLFLLCGFLLYGHACLAHSKAAASREFIQIYQKNQLKSKYIAPQREAIFFNFQNPELVSAEAIEFTAKNALIEFSRGDNTLELLKKYYEFYLDVLRYYNFYLPYQNELIEMEKLDLRGFLYFQLIAFDSITHLASIEKALLQMCLVAQNSRKNCLEEILESNNLEDKKNIYNKYILKNYQTYTDLFELDEKLIANDIYWNNTTLVLPLHSIKNKDLENKIKRIVETHYKTSTWKLEIQFKDDYKKNEIVFTDDGIPYVFYERSYATLYLPENFNLDLQQSQQILAHEFGHFLGLKDCYINFYDTQDQHYVYFELDSQNLMCHLNGKITKNSLDKIENYFRKK